jgi:hypothetical protein
LNDLKSTRLVRRREGQTLIIALFVTFILIFLGLLFAGIIAHNLFFANRAQSSTSADNFAESGVRYAHQQLLTSPQGADWRPDPANLDSTYSNTDPDYYWLKQGGPDGLGSFSRITFDQGRALIRVTYNPRPDPNPYDTKVDPYSRYLKIESIGRVGEFRPSDPTMLLGATTQLWREKIAYAPIGITDYARFVTNLDRIPRMIEFGIPTDFGAMCATSATGSDVVSVPMFVGDPALVAGWGSQSQGSQTYGGPMRFNGGLQVVGDLRVYLNPDMGDKLEVAGEIVSPDPSISAQQFRVLTQAGSQLITNSSNGAFSTFGGLVRDGRRVQDVQGYPRGIEYLAPPIMNEVDPATGRERYRAATRFSGNWVKDANGNYFNTGRLGFGQGIYVENSTEIQSETQGFSGGQSLRSEWLNPNGGSAYWQGPYYVPPGCHIQLLHDGLIITRDSRDDGQTWRNPLTNEVTARHSVRFYLYKDLASPTGVFSKNDMPGGDVPKPFNGVIYCEGNARIRGIIPGGIQLTVASGGTIYVEGSIVKDTTVTQGNFATAALSLLAHDYICVNTSQFVGPVISSPLNFEPDAQDTVAPYHISISQGRPFQALFEFGEDPRTYQGPDEGKNPRLYVRHAADSGGASYMNLLVNGGLYQFANAYPNGAGDFFPTTMAAIPIYGLTLSQYQVYSKFEHTSFALAPPDSNNRYALDYIGQANYLTFQSDPSVQASMGNRLYLLSSVAVQPLDVKIEALMYAQTGSFFVIPGAWLNNNPNDRRDVYYQGGSSKADRDTTRLNNFGTHPEFPFYGEPLDVRIRIVGAIAENFPPAMADQQEWLRHWAWTPKEYGGSGMHIPTRLHDLPLDSKLPYAANLSIVHDPTFTTARAGGLVSATTNVPPLRVDKFGRTLPATPMLPVSPKLLYFGEVHP